MQKKIIFFFRISQNHAKIPYQTKEWMDYLFVNSLDLPALDDPDLKARCVRDVITENLAIVNVSV